MEYELFIQNGDNILYPVIEDEIKLVWERKKTPGKLDFVVLKDSLINFQEGNPVKFSVNKTPIFYGFVFTKKRTKDGRIQVTAYDQLRYLKNKDTFIEEGLKASELIKRLAKDFRLNTGTIEDTGYKIDVISEENQTLFDMIQNALDETLMNNKKLFVLYDDVGKLTLKNINDMKLDILIDADTGENYSYESSIDGNTYNKIKLVYEDKDAGKRRRFEAKDSAMINQWGVLQYFEKINTPTGAANKAENLLGLYDQKTRKLKVENAFGDIRVRGGSTLIIKLNLGDLLVNNYMTVEKVTHSFKSNNHSMTMDLIGGGFIA